MSASSKPRRKQADRSQETIRKLAEATLRCIARDGYAATSITRIVKEAGLSRGAHIHHFSTKEQLIRATCEVVYANMYRNVGKIMSSALDGTDRVRPMIDGFWRQVCMAAEGRVVLELMIAARADPTVASFVIPSFQKMLDDFDIASEHYFLPRDPEKNAASIIQEAIWELWGIRLRSFIVQESPVISEHVENLIKRLETLLVGKPGVGPLPNLPREAQETHQV